MYKLGFKVNDNESIKPKILLISGLIATTLCFILLMTLAGFELYNTHFQDKLFDPISFFTILGLMSFAILPISFIASMFLVFGSRFISYLIKAESEGYKWMVAFVLGLALGIVVTLSSSKMIMIPIFTFTSLWGASLVSLLSHRIEKLNTNVGNKINSENS